MNKELVKVNNDISILENDPVVGKGQLLVSYKTNSLDPNYLNSALYYFMSEVILKGRINDFIYKFGTKVRFIKAKKTDGSHIVSRECTEPNGIRYDPDPYAVILLSEEAEKFEKIDDEQLIAIKKYIQNLVRETETDVELEPALYGLSSETENGIDQRKLFMLDDEETSVLINIINHNERYHVILFNEDKFEHLTSPDEDFTVIEYQFEDVPKYIDRIQKSESEHVVVGIYKTTALDL